MSTYLYVIQIVVSIALIAVILVQSKGAGGLGGLFGGGGDSSGVYKTRRGVERTLFQVTVGLSIIFLIFSVINVILA